MSKFLIAATLLWSTFACGHPLGNFSVSHYSKLEMTAGGVRIFYVLDLAEIPTFELLQKWGVKPGNAVAAVNQHAASEAYGWIEKLSVKVDGRAVKLELEDAKLSLADGAANMPVARIEMWARGDASPGKLEYVDGNYIDREGWKEVVVVPGKGGRVVSSTAGDTDRSSALKRYPTDVSIPLPQVTRATVT